MEDGEAMGDIVTRETAYKQAYHATVLAYFDAAIEHAKQSHIEVDGEYRGAMCRNEVTRQKMPLSQSLELIDMEYETPEQITTRMIALLDDGSPGAMERFEVLAEIRARKELAQDYDHEDGIELGAWSGPFASAEWASLAWHAIGAIMLVAALCAYYALTVVH